MAYKDSRIKLVNEVLNGIKVLCAIEASYTTLYLYALCLLAGDQVVCVGASIPAAGGKDARQ